MYKIYGFFDLKSITLEFFERIVKIIPAERAERIERYKNFEDKKLSAISYLICIYALNDFFSIKNPIIKSGKKGKPFLPDNPYAYFNISHCKSGCVCAVSDVPIGIDIQDNSRYSYDVANKFCCQNELDYIDKKEDKSKAFTEIWAMKESYVKMTGEGICTDLKGIDALGMSDMIKVLDCDDYVIAVCNQNSVQKTCELEASQ